MTHLNASNNKLSDLIDYKPPKCMEFIDLSFNDIKKMRDLKELRFLKELNLNNNKISTIEGVSGNKNLQVRLGPALIIYPDPEAEQQPDSDHLRSGGARSDRAASARE